MEGSNGSADGGGLPLPAELAPSPMSRRPGTAPRCPDGSLYPGGTCLCLTALEQGVSYVMERRTECIELCCGLGSTGLVVPPGMLPPLGWALDDSTPVALVGARGPWLCQLMGRAGPACAAV